MPTDLPIACSLTATEIPARLAEISAFGQVASLLSVERAPLHATLRFRAEGDTHKRLAAIVAAEAECCAFLDMTLREEREAVELAITVPPGAEPVLDSLVAAFNGQAQTA
jgi:hypothetical protein